MKRTALTALGCFCCVLALHAAAPKQKMAKFIQKEMDFAISQSVRMYESVKDQDAALVNTARDGRLVTCPSRDWVAGFFPGTLWYLYENSGDEALRAAAERMTERMAPEQYNKTNHDVGFMIYCSYGNGWRLTGRDDYRQVIVNAGNSLSMRFNPAVGCTRSWDPQPQKNRDFIVIVDNMMNLELLTVTSALTGDAKFMDMARTHANTTIRNHYRPDYSSWHVVNYDGQTGEIVRKETEQGYSDDSAWARGQAWGLYGYTMMARKSGEPAYLSQAENIAKMLLQRLPKDGIPYWDFDAPDIPDALRDASAGAIMASAFIDLARQTADSRLAKQCRRMAEKQLRTLASPEYLAPVGENCHILLRHSVGSLPGNSEVDVPLTYADYYFLEALLKWQEVL